MEFALGVLVTVAILAGLAYGYVRLKKYSDKK